jgi:hypothetical protein
MLKCYYDFHLLAKRKSAIIEKVSLCCLRILAGTGLQPVSKCFETATKLMILKNNRNGLQTRSRKGEDDGTFRQKQITEISKQRERTANPLPQNIFQSYKCSTL